MAGCVCVACLRSARPWVSLSNDGTRGLTNVFLGRFPPYVPLYSAGKLARPFLNMEEQGLITLQKMNTLPGTLVIRVQSKNSDNFEPVYFLRSQKTRKQGNARARFSLLLVHFFLVRCFYVGPYYCKGPSSRNASKSSFDDATAKYLGGHLSGVLAISRSFPNLLHLISYLFSSANHAARERLSMGMQST